MDLATEKIQVSVFGPFREITPQAETYINLFNLLKDDSPLPSNFNIFNLDTLKNKAEVESRISLFFNKYECNCIILPDRIDVNSTENDNSIHTRSLDLNSCCEQYAEIIRKIIDGYHIQVNRIAINTCFFLTAKGNSEKKFFRRFVNHPIPRYQQELTPDWSIRTNKLEQFNSSLSGEQMNNICEIYTNYGEAGIHIRHDVNTFHLNNKYRFKGDNLSEFQKQSKALIDQDIKKITELLHN